MLVWLLLSAAAGAPSPLKETLERSVGLVRWQSFGEMTEELLDQLERAAIAWLKANVYKRDPVTLEVEELDALVRFTGRPGKRQTRAF